MILLVAIVCLLNDPVDVKCKTEVIRMNRTWGECAELVPPTKTLLVEQTAQLPVVYIALACKSGTVG
jgi:hypothetical protein